MKVRFGLGTLVGLLLCNAALSAQINMAAIAQFKANQQHELAQSLAKSNADGSAARHAKHKGNSGPAQAEKPPIIYAHNPTFKGNYSDIHKKNVR